MRFLFLTMTMVWVLGGCTRLRELVARPLPMDEQMAQSITIARDEWNVPHIYGPTDASVAFGAAYAQAEDHYQAIEDSYMRALGRASHWYGERYLADDLIRTAFEVERHAREEYAREPADRKLVWDAFAAGLNYYMRTARVQPRLIVRWEPWMLFAHARTISADTRVDSVSMGTLGEMPGDRIQLMGVAATAAQVREPGAIAWAIAPARTATRHAMLLQTEYGAFFGGDRPYELQLESDEGWRVRGVAALGSPIPRAGHTARTGWSHTSSSADHVDVYAVVFDHPGDTHMYRYDGEWRRAVDWADTLHVNTTSGVVARAYRFRRTHHGPVIAAQGNRQLALRVARMEEGGSLQQWYAMGRARNLAEFQAALAQRALTVNTMYADADGNIYHVHGNAVPVRDTAHDWTRPTNGNTAQTEWRGFHELSSLPQLLNPRSGWLQSAGGAPADASDDTDPRATGYPRYMVGDIDYARSRSARRLLVADSAWTLELLGRAAFDTYLPDARDAIRQVTFEWEEVGGRNPARARRLDDAVDLLRAWDFIATPESEAMTLFAIWQEHVRAGGYDGAFGALRALEDALTTLERDWRSQRVKWGDVNRLHRAGPNAGADESESVPVAGAPAWLGSLFSLHSVPAGGRRRYGVAGYTWLSAVEFAPTVDVRSLVPFAVSADSSAVQGDQMSLYARGELKRVWTAREDVMAHARRVYRPGQQIAPVVER